jgi:hypothetical protein
MIDFAQGKTLGPQPVGLLGDEYKNSVIDSSGHSDNKNRNRLKSNHYNITTNDLTDTPDPYKKVGYFHYTAKNIPLINPIIKLADTDRDK